MQRYWLHCAKSCIHQRDKTLLEQQQAVPGRTWGQAGPLQGGGVGEFGNQLPLAALTFLLPFPGNTPPLSFHLQMGSLNFWAFLPSLLFLNNAHCQEERENSAPLLVWVLGCLFLLSLPYPGLISPTAEL